MANSYSNKRSLCWKYMKYEDCSTKTHVLCQFKTTTATTMRICNAKLKLTGNSSVMSSSHLLCMV